MGLLGRVLYVLLAVFIAVLACWVLFWGLSLVGFDVPGRIQTIVLAIFVIMAILGGWSGKMDSWFKWPA